MENDILQRSAINPRWSCCGGGVVAGVGVALIFVAMDMWRPVLHVLLLACIRLSRYYCVLPPYTRDPRVDVVSVRKEFHGFSVTGVVRI